MKAHLWSVDIKKQTILIPFIATEHPCKLRANISLFGGISYTSPRQWGFRSLEKENYLTNLLYV